MGWAICGWLPGRVVGLAPVIIDHAQPGTDPVRRLAVVARDRMDLCRDTECLCKPPLQGEGTAATLVASVIEQDVNMIREERSIIGALAVGAEERLTLRRRKGRDICGRVTSSHAASSEQCSCGDTQ